MSTSGRPSHAAKLRGVTKKAQVLTFLKSQSTLSLGTTAEDGTPEVAPLFYLADDQLRLYWLSSANSRHSRNLKRTPLAAITVYAPAEDWKQIQGVQLEGTAVAVTVHAERDEMIAAYCIRFRLGPQFQATIARSRLYRFQPAWIRYLDNSQRFGYKFELRMKDTAG